jgi:type I restriction enzyme S subunit
MNDNLVHRDELERRTESKLTPEQHLLVRKGDIAYNMMRMWQGACGLALTDGMVSPAYVVLAPKEGIDSRFAYHWFKTDRMIYLFWAYSHGLTEDRLRLYFDDFATIPALPPAMSEQRHLVDVLDAWDLAIGTAESLLTKTRQRFDGLLQRLIGIHQSAVAARSQWRHSELGELAKLCSGGTPNRATAAFWGGQIPWISAKDLKEFDIFESIDTLTEVGASEVTVAPKGAILLLVRGMGLFKDIPLGVTSRPVAFNQDVKALLARRDVHPRFLAYALRSRRAVMMDRVDHAGHGTGRLSTDFLEGLPIAFPKKDEQTRLITVLDAANKDIQLAAKAVECLRTQKRALMQKLLSDEWLHDSGANLVVRGSPILTAMGTP